MAVERRGESWRVRLRKPGGGWVSESFVRRTDADRFERETKGKLSAGSFVDPRAGRIPFGEYATEYLAAKNGVEDSTKGNIESRIRKQLAPFATMPLVSIRPSDVESWQSATRKTVANATVNAAHGTLRQILRRAVRDGLIPRNVAEDVDPLPMTQSRIIRPATTEAIHALAAAIDPRFSAAIIFAALASGCRSGEMWALKVDDIDWIPRRVHIARSVDDRTGQLVTKLPKNGKTRWVNLDEITVAILAEHVREYPSRDGYLFTSPDGGPVMHRNWVPRFFNPAVQEVSSLPPRFRPHDLRHTHASLLFAMGARPEQVKDRLGHGSIKTTYDWYQGFFEHHDAALLADLGNLVSGSSGDHLVTISET